MAYTSVWKKIQPKSSYPLKKLEKGSVTKILPQSTKPTNIPRDRSRPAKLPGKRISKSGKEYWETRGNRSDLPRKRI